MEPAKPDTNFNHQRVDTAHGSFNNLTTWADKCSLKSHPTLLITQHNRHSSIIRFGDTDLQTWRLRTPTVHASPARSTVINPPQNSQWVSQEHFCTAAPLLTKKIKPQLIKDETAQHKNIYVSKNSSLSKSEGHINLLRCSSQRTSTDRHYFLQPAQTLSQSSL